MLLLPFSFTFQSLYCCSCCCCFDLLLFFFFLVFFVLLCWVLLTLYLITYSMCVYATQNMCECNWNDFKICRWRNFSFFLFFRCLGVVCKWCWIIIEVLNFFTVSRENRNFKIGGSIPLTIPCSYSSMITKISCKIIFVSHKPPPSS